MVDRHSTSNAKLISDRHQVYNYLGEIRANLGKIQDLGTNGLITNPVTDDQLAAIDTQILEMRSLIPGLDA